MLKFLKKPGTIVISLGDEGAILTCFGNDRLEGRIFTSSPYSVEVTEFFRNKESYKVLLLLDTIDQNFIFANLPPVGQKNLNKIIQRKLSTEFDQEDINACYFLGKEESKVRKDLRYVFVSVRNSPPVSEWVEFVSSLPNIFAGIYLVPVEAEDLLIKIKSLKKVSKKSNDDWDILISQNRVGGFRQIVFRGGRLIFTRISQSLSIQSPDSVGMNVSQEASNTLEYIRRIGYTDQKISFFVLTSKDSEAYIDISGINKQDVYHLSPYDIAQSSNIKNSALENDKFGDVVIASNFVSSKKILRLETKEIKKTIDFLKIRTASLLTLNFLTFFFPLLSLYFIYDGYSNSSRTDELTTSISSVQSRATTVKDFEKEYKLNPQMLSDVLRVNENLTTLENKDYIEMVSKFSKAVKDKLDIISYAFKIEASDTYRLTFRGTLNYNVDDVSDIFFKANEFKKAVETEFTGFEVKIENLPSENNLKIGASDSGKNTNPVIAVVIVGTKGQIAQQNQQQPLPPQ